MTSSLEITSLLEQDRIQWQAIADYLVSREFAVGSAEKIEHLVIASRYALAQLQRNLTSIDDLLKLEHFQLANTIIEFPEGEKIDLDQVTNDLVDLEVSFCDKVTNWRRQTELLPYYLFYGLRVIVYYLCVIDYYLPVY